MTRTPAPTAKALHRLACRMAVASTRRALCVISTLCASYALCAISTLCASYALCAHPVLAQQVPHGDHAPGGSTSVTLQELAAQMTDDALRGRYMVIPFKGAIGTDVPVEALETVVKRTGGLKPLTCIVLDIDCEGGSDEDAFRMADLIGSAVKQVPVVAYVRKCIGPATMLLFPVREVFIPAKAGPGTIIQFDAAMDLPAGDGSPGNGPPDAPRGDGSRAAAGDGLARALEMYEKLSVYDPDMRALVKALTDPSAHLYTWRGAGDSIEWSNTAPDPAPEGMRTFGPGELADGLTEKEAVACGLAREVEGGIESIGKAIGIADWRASGHMGEQLMRAASRKAAEQRQSSLSLVDTTWGVLERCSQVAAQIPRAEVQARVNEPNVQNYVNPVRAGWLANRWGPMSYTTVLWQQNCDAALTAWRNVAAMYGELDSLMRTARANIASIQAAPPRSAHAAEHAITVESLRQHLATLDARANDFAAGQRNAEARIGWLVKNRGMPPPPNW
jgi:hypothetical protein